MQTRNNGSRIFMTELMFSILFFIIVSAICIQCFATAYAKSKDASEITGAVNVAANAAEQYLADPGFEGYTEYYDENWQIVDDEGVYKTTAIITEAENKKTCQSLHIVVATADDREIYSLVVEKALK
ncbi:hypothetical protein SAMN04487831_10752 [Pseudobutyrivibrio sp. UC1225]|uniref:hypothetical protein n=1 Tax=Pseudobutyrivibrio sp. UC1225 TaxID=1798185 RepID=UPI0008E811C0|nr:hypothetical protein [Pseudobutyrivibrio sp. UC1225]SFO06506.1 hypothetical protein SAMN04487831_10752 [Pseudobutyrivibrio sp. UC1225]